MACLLYVTAAAQTAIQQHGKLSIRQGKLIDQQEKIVQLRGISLSWSIWEGKKYYTPEVVDWLVDDFKVNLIRVAMAIEPDSGYLQLPEEQFNLITKVVDRAIERGIYVLIDWHDHHANQHIEQAKKFFTKIAQRYQGNPQLIYEIWNEPEKTTWQVVKHYAIALIPTIRKYAQDNIIVVGSPHWDQDVDRVAHDPITNMNNIAYSFHFYASDPNHQERLRHQAAQALTMQLPLLVTEWGVGEANGDGRFDRKKTDIWLHWMEENQLSWTNWNLTDKNETTALLKPKASVRGHWKKNELTPAGRYIRAQLIKLNQ
ncbi:hypothetical protein GCM10023231_02280 [Olivibacter ginsenosidimutans]|uniref:Glycoside hydrolase family 5 domain-containing protein n=2 Tax=Olivibacter ginsenosidimutans TaxID=1176537 RepID=A0ABP9AEF3_9SPHI